MSTLRKKNKIARREGVDLGLKTPGSKAHATLLRRLNVPPGQLKARSRRKVSERARQLREKQKLRHIFALRESQLKNYFKKAIVKKGNTAEHLSQLLEKRLDNAVYRIGFAPTRLSARQLVNHGHIRVNDTKVTIPSFQVKQGQKIHFARPQTAQKIPAISQSLENKDLIIPNWFKRSGISGELVKSPTGEEIEKQVDLRLVIEFYSK